MGPKIWTGSYVRFQLPKSISFRESLSFKEEWDVSKERKNHRPKFKAKVALEAVKGEEIVAQLAAGHGCHRGTVSLRPVPLGRDTGEKEKALAAFAGMAPLQSKTASSNSNPRGLARFGADSSRYEKSVFDTRSWLATLRLRLER